ncbi:hypothetical protein B0H12DRAFT_1125263 [Mycena haematopus]|nr:hypothetical protein B0H12DRAFT_1125263 [Mycena haematopus]
MLSEQLRHMCDVWIRRSKSCPLSVNIEIDIDIDIGTHPVSEPLVVATHRWEHLKLCAPASFLPKLRRSMPMLRSLELDVLTFGTDVFAFYDVL